MSNIIKFRRQASSVPGLLQEILDEDSDQLAAVLVCGVTKNRLLFFHWHSGDHWAELLAATESAKHALLEEQ
jgi:hypothetical protein